MAETLKGGCHCGAVRYEINAEPILAAHCHCQNCQKVSGAGHASFAVFPEPAIRMTGKLSSYKMKADSGADVTHQFCPSCGSPIAGRNSRMSGVVGIRLASLDRPDAVTPQMTAYAKRAQAWDPVAADLPHFPGMPPMG